MEKDIFELAELYLNQCLSNRELADRVGRSVTWCVDQLKKNGLYVYKPKIIMDEKGDLKKEIIKLKKQKWNSISQKSNQSFFEENKKYEAVCKLTGKVFKDYQNRSGSLSDHLKRTVPGIFIPKARERREYELKNGHPWMAKYFDYQESQTSIKKQLHCCKCDYKTTDLHNKGGVLTKHIKDVHGISISEYVKDHPEQTSLFKTALKKEQYENRFEGKKEGVDYVKCKICEQKMSKVNNKHLQSHGITLLEYKVNYGLEGVYSDGFLQKIKDVYDSGLASYESKNSSSGQKTIYEELKKTLDCDVLLNNKSLLRGTEIDILIPELKLGIEFNGLYFHSENSGGKNLRYHVNKTKSMNDIGYCLIHVFEDEWLKSPNLVLSKIKNACGVSDIDSKIHARKCIISPISVVQKNEFLNANHIQGEDKSNIHLGAFYEDEIIAVMTFDEKRNVNQGKDKRIELKRFCVKTGVLCSGIFGKLFKFYLKNYSPQLSIVSFADMRWTVNLNENIYTLNNFVLDKILPPDYTYVNSSYSRGNRIYKYSFGKKSLKKRFPTLYSETKSEWEIMQEAGFDRIWDCGKARFVYNSHMNCL